MRLTNFFLLLFLCTPFFHFKLHAQKINLNGTWDFGVNRQYSKKVEVPGIPVDPTKFSPDDVSYKREVKLPEGNWTYATLQLKGARFAPKVYVNNKLVAQKNGGMAPLFFVLQNSNVAPGNIITLEIVLSSLNQLPTTDASYIPTADHWRSNIASYLWDDVVLKLHHQIRIKKITPHYRIDKKQISFQYEIEAIENQDANATYSLHAKIVDKNNKLLIEKSLQNCRLTGKFDISYNRILKLWSPQSPNLYKLELSVKNQEKILDTEFLDIGIRKFEVNDKQFYLNNKPCKVAAGTVVWHRWSRDWEYKDLVYDTLWFRKYVIEPLKQRGANTLRFHLGNPPERFLKLCDRYGLLVQYEWSFFHGMPASLESLIEQWPNWLDLAMQHPSVVLIHPYNETEKKQLTTVWEALDEILPNYPPLVIKERDVLHIHKYWWSLFENLGLYYDDYQEFPKAIMVDEFGGNYLDGKGDMGLYPTIPEAYLRFLGRGHTRRQRLHHHTISNARVAEYWRRIGAAGFSPFCILGSKNDGNHWYIGNLNDGELKPVWNALTAAWSPKSVSIAIWDRNFTPNQKLWLPIHFFNDTENADKLKVNVWIEDTSRMVGFKQTIEKKLGAYTKTIDSIQLQLPDKEGTYTIKAELLNPPVQVKYPVISQWNVHVYQLKIPEKVKNSIIAIPEYETELQRFASENKLNTTAIDDQSADVILVSRAVWDSIATRNSTILQTLEKAIDNGISVVMLDIGDIFLGQGYLNQAEKLSFTEGRYVVRKTVENQYNLLKGIQLTCKRIAEPESHIHPAKNNSVLWENIPNSYTRLWNGLKGGLIVPANHLEISGLNSQAYLTKWVTRGADKQKIRDTGYYAYELQGFYRFSNQLNDKKTIQSLRDEVEFLVEDAPALTGSVNPNAPIAIINLSEGYCTSRNGVAKNMQPLANCGRNLTQTPVIMVEFGKEKGKIILSQLITNGRLAKKTYHANTRAAKHDVIACQLVINMLKTSIFSK